MRIEIELANYRCFPIDKPARFAIEPGVTSIIGMNNAGKSALLKFFWEFRSLFSSLRASPEQALSVVNWQPPAGVDPRECFGNRQHPMRIQVMWSPGRNKRAVPFGMEIHIPLEENAQAALFIPGVQNAEGRPLVNAKNLREFGLDGDVIDFAEFRRVCGILANNLQLPQLRYVEGGGDSRMDLELGGRFIQKWDVLSSGDDETKRTRMREITSRLGRLLGADDFELRPNQSNTTMFAVIDGIEKPLGQLGSGISQCILLVTHAMLEEKEYIIVDEPELSLHPQKQIELIVLLRDLCRSGVIVATHSMALARSCPGPIYAITRHARSGNVPAYSSIKEFAFKDEHAALIGALSYSGVAELGCTAILAVEGKNDFFVAHDLVRRFGAGGLVMVVPLSGSAGIAKDGPEILASMSQHLSVKVFCIVDKEQPTADRATFTERCRKLGIEAVTTEYCAIENYMTLDAVKRLRKNRNLPTDNLRPIGTADKPDEKLHGFVKRDVPAIASLMSNDEWLQNDFGLFVNKVAAAAKEAAAKRT